MAVLATGNEIMFNHYETSTILELKICSNCDGEDFITSSFSMNAILEALTVCYNQPEPSVSFFGERVDYVTLMWKALDDGTKNEIIKKHFHLLLKELGRPTDDSECDCCGSL